MFEWPSWIDARLALPLGHLVGALFAFVVLEIERSCHA